MQVWQTSEGKKLRTFQRSNVRDGTFKHGHFVNFHKLQTRASFHGHNENA